SGLWGTSNNAFYPRAPYTQTADVLIGGTSTESATFAFINVAGGVPTASIAGQVAGSALYITGDGNIQTTLNRTLTVGGDNTGDIVLDTSAEDHQISLTAGAGEIDLTTTGTTDINTGTFDLDASGAFLVDGAGTSSNISLAADSDADDLTVAVTGAFNSSLILSSAGTGADAIDINAAAGGITIDAADVLSVDVTAANAASNISVVADNDAEDLTIEVTGSAGDLLLSSADVLGLTGTTSITLSDGSNLYTTFDSVNTNDLSISVPGGNILSSSALNFGGDTEQAYNFFASASTADHTNSSEIEDVDDLYIGDDLEVDGTIWGDASIFQAGNQVCDTSGNCSGSGLWALTANAFYPRAPYTDIVDVLIGGS
ncbi:MAG: hypothetical protein KAJ73_10075, partial [Zetaproteobacteria bacterium]|nr:hypothetical protein [Zetaproteobacteria bacterium]